MPSMQTTDVTPERLQRLATLEAPGGFRVLSLYLDLDPQSNLAMAGNRPTVVNSLLDAAGRAVEGQEDLDHDAHMALREDVSRARERLEANLDDDWAEGAHALALFVCGPADLFEVVKLPRAVENHVAIADRPAIARAVEVGLTDRWAVLLLDGNDARLLEGRGDRLEETVSERSDHRGRTARGGMSAQRYERTVGMEENEFLRSVAAKLQEVDRRRPLHRIVIGTTERHYTLFVNHLEDHLRAKVIDRFDAGADWERTRSVREKVEPILQKDDTHREAEALARAAYPGVRGLTETLPALYERRVDTLLLEPGLEHPGVVCPRCRWASAEERGMCPVDGEEMRPHPNLVDWAVATAVAADARVLAVRHHNDLSEHDGIGAALRF